AAVRASAETRPAPPISVTEPKSADDTLSSETSVRFDQQDALAEADFHMAYGLYDQAADLVKIAIEREPARRDLKLKLLEIYFVWGNRDLFLDTARELHSTRNQAAPGEWDKVLIMGRQIAAEDPIFKADGAPARVDLVDLNLEGGENRVDVDLFAEPESESAGGLDLEFGTGEHVAAVEETPSASDLDFLLDESKDSDDESTREMDHLSRTQETPTIESPALDRSSQTMREKVDAHTFAQAGRNGIDQTAELSLDDLGLDVDSLETTGTLEQTASLERDIPHDLGKSLLRDDEMTQLAPSLSSLDRTMEAPRISSNDRTVESPRISSTDRTMESPRIEKFDIESTGTIYIDQVDLSGGDTVEQPRFDIDATASMKSPTRSPVDVDLDNIDEPISSDTVRHTRNEDDSFSDDVFADRTSQFPRVDLDVGDALHADDHAPTNKQVVNEMELSELEPVTMSEVGTKLDLARAYMDMGDPDGARSILEEVLQEGTSNQKQEAQRLLDSIR
ncbi:MAG: FimV/HubP family polar landmark protein, partial [Povalibacter sp.]